jgi:SAM-dependent MidA family methyltransferase
MRVTTAAEAAIREAIALQGPITFRQFMEMALYSAPGAYYASGTGQIGADGDYFTSPEIHPSFGALLARQIEQVWGAMDRPEIFSLIEMGAGSGALARDILSYSARWSPDFFQAIEYVILERNPDFVRRQQLTLTEIGPAGERVAWKSAPPPGNRPPVVRGCVISNELPDAFPVHRVVVERGVLKEIYVDVDGDRIVEKLGDPSTPALGGYFGRLGFLPPEGARVEVNLDALGWIRQIAGALRRGVVITVDYGYPARELYSERHMDGSLLCFYRHTMGDDPYVRIGQQDMTTHVDFTSLSLEGEAAGLRTVGLTTQRAFLTSLGLDHYLRWLTRLELRASDYDANLLAMKELVNADGLGRVKVLVQEKDLGGFGAASLRPEGIQPDDLRRDTTSEPPPLLSRAHMRLNSTPASDLLVDTRDMWDELMGGDED